MSIKNVSAAIFNPKTEIVDLSQASATQNTWYTILDTSESGFLQLIRGYYPTNPEKLEFQVTLDGVAKTYSVTGASQLAISDNADDYFVIPFNDYYGTSIKVEIRHTVAATPTIMGYVVRRSYV